MVQSIDSTAFFEQQQLPLLRRQLIYLQSNSPYYRSLFQQSGFHATHSTSWSDFTALPLTGKKELTKHNRDFLAVVPEKIIDVCQTSGITGPPVTIWQTEADLQRLATNEQQALSAAGIGVNDRVLIGAALDRVFMAGLAYFLGLRKIGATAIRAGSGQPALVAELVCQQRPNVLIGVPSLLLLVAQQLRQQKKNPATLGIDKLICIGEPIRNEDLSLSSLGKALQQEWKAHLFGTYASTEMATAFADCCCGKGGHLLSELMVVEILDHDGQPVSAGVAGEVVVTPLGIEGTPLLRYRTGDIARLHHEKCCCGHSTPRLGPIIGRRAQMLKCRGTTLFPTVIAQVLQGLAGVKGYYLEVYSEFDLSDRLRVVIGCCDSRLSRASVAAAIAAKTRVKPEIVLVTPEEIIHKTIRPELRKPVTFFDYRNSGNK